LTKCSLHLTALYVVKKTTDCRIFSCQKTFTNLSAFVASRLRRDSLRISTGPAEP